MADSAYTWVFARRESIEADRIRIVRPTPFRLVVSSPEEGERTFDFDTPVALLEFQLDLEARLIQTGWDLEEFFPERRSGVDRRNIPRALDRRRYQQLPAKIRPITH